MSEYQYLEFVAVDRPLTPAQQAEVRSLSTRARITATSFTNVYHWSGFRGDPLSLVRRYYDAHLYLTNWGSRHLFLRVPASALDEDAAAVVGETDLARVIVAGEHRILSVIVDSVTSSELAEELIDSFNDDLGEDDAPGGGGWLGQILPARALLLEGDQRLLYLVWLLSVQAGHMDDDDVEPPVPAGLGDLPGCLVAFAHFFGLSEDLMDVAAQASPDLGAQPSTAALRAYVADLPAQTKDDVVVRLLAGQGGAARAELLRGFRGAAAAAAAAAAAGGAPDNAGQRRTAGELLGAEAAVQLERQRAEQAARERQRAEREERLAAQTRARREALASQGEGAWQRVEALIAQTKPEAYDEAVAVLADLQVIAVANGTSAEFARRVAQLRDDHARKPSLVSRLVGAGLVPR
ncbi:hypothetical protein [Quadrisphaera granulorum]|uniref:hypothetical protein n=1 Tax=Quadrisphaera granulorum TaxID=317664 RepID=UPI000D6CCA62|nr:hypothetical protein [Quadrisphaera granulorum]